MEMVEDNEENDGADDDVDFPRPWETVQCMPQNRINEQ